MRGTVAKRIRKQVYGDDFSPRDRKYKANVRSVKKNVQGFTRVMERVFKRATVFDAGLRSIYQRTKKAYKRREGEQIHGK